MLKVHFSRHGDVTLRLAVEPKSKKVIDLWSEGEHNRSSRLKKNDWLHGETKSFARRKKVVDFESKVEYKRSSRLEKTTDGRREKLSRNGKKVVDLRNEMEHKRSSRQAATSRVGGPKRPKWFIDK